MNHLFPRFVALSLLVAPLALVVRAQTPTVTPKPARTPKPTKTPKPTRTPKPKATPTPTPIRPNIPVSASEANNGKTIFVSRGGLIELRLAANPSTGYGWNVVSSRNLKIEGEPRYEASPHPRGMVGSGGFSVFRFRAVKQGTGDLALDLRAPGFKTGDKPAEQFRAEVRVLK